jgi:hypothetical protein
MDEDGRDKVGIDQADSPVMQSMSLNHLPHFALKRNMQPR